MFSQFETRSDLLEHLNKLILRDLTTQRPRRRRVDQHIFHTPCLFWLHHGCPDKQVLPFNMFATRKTRFVRRASELLSYNNRALRQMLTP